MTEPIPMKSDEAHIPERRYRMTRIEAGDYLLPSNDLQTLWRITAYEDEDDDFKGCGGCRTVTIWGLSSRPYPEPDEYLDLPDWDGWDEGISYGHRTRKEAVQAAMSRG